MFGQYLSNTNESATIPVLQIFFELNKAKFLKVPMLLNLAASVTSHIKDAQRFCHLLTADLSALPPAALGRT